MSSWERMAKKSLSRALEIWKRRSVSRLLRSKMLYTLGRSQLILRASHEGVRSCASSSCLMSLPICTIKNVELLLLVSTITGSRIAYLNQRTSNTEAHVDMNILPNALRELAHKVSDRNIHTSETSILLSPLTLIMNLRDS